LFDSWDSDPASVVMDEDLGDNEKIENIKFREKSWEDKNNTPRQTRPNVSAVS